jgi:hypothetical protein
MKYFWECWAFVAGILIILLITGCDDRYQKGSKEIPDETSKVQTIIDYGEVDGCSLKFLVFRQVNSGIYYLKCPKSETITTEQNVQVGKRTEHHYTIEQFKN